VATESARVEHNILRSFTKSGKFVDEEWIQNLVQVKLIKFRAKLEKSVNEQTDATCEALHEISELKHQPSKMQVRFEEKLGQIQKMLDE
ncbi:hypothetical protein HK096_011333, partial [Nowakowskiella sp. JEL0078]